MRRSGKTTRLINDAVEHLFKNGSMTLFTGRQTRNSDFVDEDASEGNMAQAIFIDRVRRRLSIEHQSQIEITKVPNGFTFKVK